MIEIVPFSKHHISGVVDVILPIQQLEFDIPITLDDQPDLLDIPGFYQKGSGNFWVALHGSEIVGTIALLDIGNNQGALRKMFVKAQFRGSRQGVARRLLRVLLDWCELHNIYEIYLGTTAKFLAAHRFYEKNGFLEIQQSELPISFPVMSVDTKFYKYLLANGGPNMTLKRNQEGEEQNQKR
jgi:N-acetylglutamate synthase-like GNAT family acetyltransferase